MMTTSLSRLLIQNKSKIYLIILIAVTLSVTTRGITHSDFWFSDEAYHAMDGVFFLDLIKDRPFTDLYHYAERYYAKYPALSLNWYPPLFAIIEAIFFSVFVISVFTARLTIVLFALMMIYLWYLLIKKIFGDEVAFFSGFLFVTTPLIVLWSNAVMLEIPTVAMIILSCYCFYNYVELGKKRYAYFLGLSISGAILMKQTAGFIIPLFFSYMIIRKKYRTFLQKEVIISCLIVIVFLVPLLIFTLNFGNLGLAMTVGNLNETDGNNAVKNWLHFSSLLPDTVIWPVFALSIISVFLVLTKLRNRNWELFFILWAFWWYVCFGYMFSGAYRDSHSLNYYAFYIVPVFCLFAYLTVDTIKNKMPKLRILSFFVLLGICVYQFTNAANAKIPYLDDSYEEAAKYIVQGLNASTVLVSMYYNGNFIFHTRKYDIEREMIILRAEKMLTSFAVFIRYGVYTWIDNETDIYTMLKDYGVKYIIIEDKDLIGLQALRMLRNVLKTEDFALLKQIKVESSPRKDMSILIYEYNHHSDPRKDILEIKFPHMGRTIRVPLKSIQSF